VSTPRHSGLRFIGFCTSLALICGPTLAQQPPDAGGLLRDQPKPPPAAAPKPAPAKPAAAPAPTDGGPTILVKGFRIVGATLIPPAELNEQLKDFIDQDLTISQLQRAAPTLIAYYARKGYLARVVLPPQEVKDGIVSISVIEGRRGELQVERKDGSRLDAARVRAFVERRLGAGSAMNIANLEESLNILNDQPGVIARSSVAPGSGEGGVDVVVSAEDKPLWNFAIGANNHGARASGAQQVNGYVGLSNPTGLFDAASLLVNASRGTTFGRLDYSLAAGNSGLRLGVNASALDYDLVQPVFSALQSNGTARTVGLSAAYPLFRHAERSLSLGANLDAKRLRDLTVAGETSNRRVHVASFGLSGFASDQFFGGGTTQYDATVSAGESDQRNAAALAADLATRQVQGSYSKFNYGLRRLQALSGDWNLSAALRGQLASKNLDSTERFVLGGPSAVRAYPVGEAAADEGWLLQLALGWRASEQLTASFFVDTGGVKLNENLFATFNAGNPRLPNRYTLSGAGIGVDWRFMPQGVASFVIARPLGSNPGRDANDRNIDGSTNGTRGWVSVTLQF
jgi:hemolysin activation/secretion protein